MKSVMQPRQRSTKSEMRQAVQRNLVFVAVPPPGARRKLPAPSNRRSLQDEPRATLAGGAILEPEITDAMALPKTRTRDALTNVAWPEPGPFPYIRRAKARPVSKKRPPR